MVQINIDIFIFDNQLLRHTFAYAQKPQHTHVVVVMYTITTETGVNGTSACVPFTNIMDTYDTFRRSLH